jgi:hypothetical protein
MDRPTLDLKTPCTKPPDPINIPFVDLASGGSVGVTAIDINTTVITDGEKKSTLATVFKKINDDGQLVVDAEALVSDGTNEASFDFEYDADAEVFGAGTAFLQE